MSKKPGNQPKQFSTKPPAPRSLDEIVKENASLLSSAGQASYLKFVYEMQLADIHKALQNLNYEAAERKKLDAAAETKEKA